jgi:DegV family protein with EDD domain
MEEYEIFIDASVDIPEQVLTDGHVHVIPMKYSVNGEERVMDHRFSDEEMRHFYQLMRENAVVHTSQISPFEYEESFRPVAGKGGKLLYISLSSGISATCGSSRVAAQSIMDEYPDAQIECVDSLTATGGMGLALILALRNREKGMSLAENAAFLREHMNDISLWMMVDDLVYLKRGGRITPVMAAIGSVLNVKPVIGFNHTGKLVSVAKQRGAAKTEQYIGHLYEETHDFSLGREVIIVHADAQDRAERLKREVLTATPDAEVSICPLSLIIGVHTGPGMAAITHFGKRFEGTR